MAEVAHPVLCRPEPCLPRSQQHAYTNEFTSAAAGVYHVDIERVLFTQEQINTRLDELGRVLAHDYRDADLVVVGVLKGAFMFTADLVRRMLPCPERLEVDFVKASSYGAGTESSGNVALSCDDLGRFRHKDVLLVEDIVDTGLTLSALKANLQHCGCCSVRVAALLNKAERRKCDLQPEYVGFQCPNEFVVGYGLDFNEQYRGLPYIGVLKPQCYEGK